MTSKSHKFRQEEDGEVEELSDTADMVGSPGGETAEQGDIEPESTQIEIDPVEDIVPQNASSFFTRIPTTQVVNASNSGSKQHSIGAVSSYIPTTEELRRLQISRRGAVPPLSLPRPRPALTQAQRRERLTAFRNVVGEPVPEPLLRIHLIDRGWDVNLAAQAYRDEVAATQNLRPASTARHRGLRTIGQARIDAMRALYNEINRDRAADQRDRQEISDILGLLHAHQWDPEAALEAYQRLNGDLSTIRETMNQLRRRHPSQNQRDRRLADFLTFTDVNNWYSALKFLEGHQWDVSRALDAWYAADGNIPQAPSIGVRDNGFRYFRQPNTQERNGPIRSSSPPISPKTTSAMQDADLPANDWSPASSLLSENADAASAIIDARESRGHIVNNTEWQPATVNCPDGSKLIVERILKGEYKPYTFDKLDKATAKRFRFNDSDHSSDEEKIELDWTNSSHVVQINAWRRQLYRRTFGSQTTRREPYLDVEMEFIWLLHAQHLEEVLEDDPEYFENGNRLPLNVTSERLVKWAQQFNDRFAGKTDVEGIQISSSPRPPRTTGSIHVQRHRIGAVIRDFLLTPNIAHPSYQLALTGRGHGVVKGRRQDDTMPIGAEAEYHEPDDAQIESPVTKAPGDSPEREKRHASDDSDSEPETIARRPVKRRRLSYDANLLGNSELDDHDIETNDETAALDAVLRVSSGNESDKVKA